MLVAPSRLTVFCKYLLKILFVIIAENSSLQAEDRSFVSLASILCVEERKGQGASPRRATVVYCDNVSAM